MNYLLLGVGIVVAFFVLVLIAYAMNYVGAGNTFRKSDRARARYLR